MYGGLLGLPVRKVIESKVVSTVWAWIKVGSLSLPSYWLLYVLLSRPNDQLDATVHSYLHCDFSPYTIEKDHFFSGEGVNVLIFP